MTDGVHAYEYLYMSENVYVRNVDHESVYIVLTPIYLSCFDGRFS